MKIRYGASARSGLLGRLESSWGILEPLGAETPKQPCQACPTIPKQAKEPPSLPDNPQDRSDNPQGRPGSPRAGQPPKAGHIVPRASQQVPTQSPGPARQSPGPTSQPSGQSRSRVPRSGPGRPGNFLANLTWREVPPDLDGGPGHCGLSRPLEDCPAGLGPSLEPGRSASGRCGRLPGTA